MQYDLKHLLSGYLTCSLSEDEKQSLTRWLAEDERHQALFKRICDTATMTEKMSRMRNYNQEEAWLRLKKKITPKKILWKGWRYVAILSLPMLVAGGLLYGILAQESPGEQAFVNTEQEKITGARIILADGEVVALQQEGKYAMDTHDGIRLEQDNGKLTLIVSGQKENKEVHWHTVVTPRGGEYHIELPDGTHVWLNAESSLRFPSAFVGGQRKVEMTGEGYFEVAHDDVCPFIVTTGEVQVNVLGTKFNVRAYPESHYTTTLLEGKVQVEKEQTQVVLAPGQQVVVNGKRLVTGKANMEAALSWINRTFVFENAPLEEIMAELGRWYDVDVVFLDNRLRGERFSIEMPRYKSVVEAAHTIERTKSIRLEVTEERIVVK